MADDPTKLAALAPGEATSEGTEQPTGGPGGGPEDGLGIISREMNKINVAAEPQTAQPATAPATPNLPAPIIPPPPAPIPGAYNPDQEQAAMRSTLTIADPERRMRVQQFLKREYANDAMMDGITQKAREDAIKKAFSEYTTAVKQIQDDPKASWQQKQMVAKELMQVMWKDPRTDYGDTRELLEKHMLGLSGMQNLRELGPHFGDALTAITDGRITDPRQIAKMVGNGSVTYNGAKELYDTLGRMNKPDDRIVAEYQALAVKRVTETIYKDLNETDPITGQAKPSGKQIHMANDIQYAILDRIRAAGKDNDAIAKITSPEAIDALIEEKYPRYERHLDHISLGAPVNVGGITVPPIISTDPKSQLAYRDTVAAPPFATNPTSGKQEQLNAAGWQMAVNGLLQKPTPENIAAFTNKYHMDAKYLLSVIKTAPVPAGYVPPPVVAPAPAPAGFFSSLFRLGVPSPTEAPPAAAPPAEERGGFLGARPPHEYLQGVGKGLVNKALENVPTIKRPDEYLRQLFTGGGTAEEAKK
jgi:hypothetical protein